jgi:hypothetical protein
MATLPGWRRQSALLVATIYWVISSHATADVTIGAGSVPGCAGDTTFGSQGTCDPAFDMQQTADFWCQRAGYARASGWNEVTGRQSLCYISADYGNWHNMLAVNVTVTHSSSYGCSGYCKCFNDLKCSAFEALASDKHCANDDSGSYDSLAAAEAACMALGSSCSGVYQLSCSGTAFSICGTAAWETSTSGSCVYPHTGFASPAPTPVPTPNPCECFPCGSAVPQPETLAISRHRAVQCCCQGGQLGLLYGSHIQLQLQAMRVLSVW